jgi:TonB family protein
MHDRVAEVLAQRAALDRGTGTAIAFSLLLHAALVAIGMYGAMHATAPKAATMVNIQFASSPSAAMARPRGTTTPAKPKPAAPAKVEEPKPVIEEPKPVVEKTPPKPEKNTVPFSPFGRSTKKGSETPAPAKPAPAAPTPKSGTAGTNAGPVGLPGGAEVPIGGAGVTGFEGGDFPHTLYIQGMQRRIGTNWFRPQVAAGTTTVVYFRIRRDGTITESRVETSSGNGTFDRAALSAVRSSTPLNPLPFGYQGSYLGVYLTFR